MADPSSHMFDTPPAPPRAAHMSSVEFRRLGREMVDFVADYWDALDTPSHLPVMCPLKPGEFGASLPPSAPEVPDSWPAIFADIRRLVPQGLTHWQSPNFFGFFPANASFPAMLAELLSAGLGVQGMVWATSPACTELETRVLDWLAQAIGLPRGFMSESESAGGGGGGGVIQSTASEATLVALLAARHKAIRSGASQHALALYTSTQAHSSVIKAAMIAGLAGSPEDRSHLRLIPVDASLAMRADLLERQIIADRAAGLHPAFICATLGTTSSTAFDPLAAIGPIASRHALWLHVDAAYAGAMTICPEHRAMLTGIEHASSYSFNPHKWLLTNFDCAAMWTRDRAALTGALSITPEYLRNPAGADPRAIDYRDWQIPLGRRFRALKLWLVMRHYGFSGLRAHIREHLRLAALFEELLRQDPRFELAAPRTASLVCFRLAGDLSGERSRALLNAINASGKAFLSHTLLPLPRHDPELGEIADDGAAPGTPGVASGRFTLRMAIGSTLTEERHVRDCWSCLRQFADQVSSAV